jgi:site-specific DNA-methyltransferase (adenine-specific)
VKSKKRLINDKATKSKSKSQIRLIQADAIQTLAKFLPDSIDLIVTDPPYKVISGGTKSKWKSGWKISVLKNNDGKIFKHNTIKVRDWMGLLYRVLKPGRDCYVMVNNVNLLDYMRAAEEAGFKFHNLLRWDKNTKNANRWYMKDCEYTLYLFKPPARTINNPGSSQGFFAKNPRNKRHPTEKPVSLFRHYVENSSEPGWLVLDPFMGCGTAAVACLKSGRNFIGCEIDPSYFAVAQKRVNRRERLRRKSNAIVQRRETATTNNRASSR